MEVQARHVVAMLVAAVILLVALYAIHDREGVEEYNGGVCKQCGGHYVYQQAVATHYFTYYVYICDHCNRMVETGKYLGR